jgi:hypothetical protein
MKKSMPTIYADFHNADKDGFVRMNSIGTIEDLSRHGVVLKDGLKVRISDGELAADAVIRAPGKEGVWRAEINWPEVKECG